MGRVFVLDMANPGLISGIPDSPLSLLRETFYLRAMSNLWVPPGMVPQNKTKQKCYIGMR